MRCKLKCLKPFGLTVGIGLLFCWGGVMGKEKPSLDKLIADLDAADGKVRAAATKEIFGRGKEALAALEGAGAKQIAPVSGGINTRRLDAVFSLLQGLPQNE